MSIVSALGRVIHGQTRSRAGIDITPSTGPENLRRLDAALRQIDTRRADGREPSVETTNFDADTVFALQSDAGELKVVPVPGRNPRLRQSRRAATREPIGRGLRPSVASPADLARMLAALGRGQDIPHLLAMRRLIELDRGLDIER